MTDTVVFSGQISTGVVLYPADTMEILSGGTATRTTISGGTQDVYGSATRTTVFDGGIEIVYSGGSATSTTVSSGGTLELFGRAGETATTILSGGTLEIGSGYTESGFTVRDGVMLDVLSGGSAISTTISGNGIEIVYSGGSATSTIISGGTQFVFGSAISAMIGSGGTQIVESGGSATRTTICDGSQIVSSGGAAISTTIHSGGGQYIASGGTATETRVDYFGSQTVLSGGTATVTLINYGGEQDVYGSATSTIVHCGGEQDVFAGGTAIGTTIEGGTLVLQDGATTSGAITFSGPGTLEIDRSFASGGVAFPSQLADITVGDVIDLTGLAYTSATSATVSGSTLKVTNGIATETFTLTTPIVSGFTVAPDNCKTSGTWLAAIDTTPPVVAFTGVSFTDTGIQGDNLTDDATVILSGTVSDNVAVAGVVVFDGTTYLGAAVISNGGWTLTANLSDGTHSSFNATAIDTAGNTTSATNSTLVEIDTVAPAITLTTVPAATIEATGAGGAAVAFAASDTDAVDGSDAVSFTERVNGTLQTVQSGDTFAIGSHTITASATDKAGNIGTSTFTFTVVDTVAPAVTLTTVPAATIEATGAGGAAVAFAASDTDAVDGSDAVSFTERVNGTLQTVQSGDTFAIGRHTVTASATDKAGNIGTSTFTFTVVDTVAPAVTLTTVPAATIEATGATGAAVAFAASDTDAVDGSDAVSFTERVNGTLQTVQSGDTFAIGRHTVTASATDKAGNIGTSTFTFTVVDTTAPAVTLTTIPAATIEATGATGAAVAFAASDTDAVDGSDAVSFTERVNGTLQTVQSGDTFAIGRHTITASATDKAGNIGASTFTFTVVDTVAPAVTLTTVPAATIEATGATGAAVAFAASDTDAVDGSDAVSFTERVNGTPQTVQSGDTFAIGRHTITASATDKAGNIGASTFTFTVVDTVAPAVTLTTVPAATIEATGATGAAVAFAASDTDAVDGSDAVSFTERVNGTLQTVQSGDTFAIGRHTITASATDKAGNIGASTFTFTVVDTVAPAVTLTTVPAATIEATGATGAAVAFAASDTDAVDGSDAVSFTERVNGTLQTVQSGDTFAIGRHTITASATDKAGNIGASTFTFTVVDTVAPTVSSPLLMTTGNAAATAIGITVRDPNYSADRLSVTIGTLPTDGSVTLADGKTTVTAGETLTGTQLAGLLFSPTAGLFGQSATLSYTVTNPAGNFSAGTATLAIGNALAPTIVGMLANQPTTSEKPIKPFSGVTIVDPNSGVTDTLTITVGGTGGRLSGTGLQGGTNGVYSLTDTAAAVTAELEALVFTPTAGAPNSISKTTFALSDQSSAGPGASNSATSVLNSDPAVAPTISGTVANQTTTDRSTIDPFSSVVIGDANVGLTETVIVTVGTPANGTLSTAGSGAVGDNGATFTFSGTTSAVQAALRALIFTPTANEAVPGGVVTTGLTLSVSDGLLTTTDSTTSVLATAVGTIPLVTIGSTAVFTNNPTQILFGTSSTSGFGATAVAGTLVSLYDNGGSTPIGTAIVNADGTWSTSLTLAQGLNSIVARDTDIAGNTGTSTLILDTLDTVSPDVLIGSTGGSVTEATQILFGTSSTSGFGTTAVAGTLLFFYDNGGSTPIGTATVDADGSWSTSLTLAQGANSIVARDTDVAGNTGISTAVVFNLSTISVPGGQHVDHVPPQLSVDPAVSLIGPTAFTITGTVSDASGIASVKVFAQVNGKQRSIGVASIGTDGRWTITDNAGPVSQSAITVVATDGAGNQTTILAPFDLTAGVKGQPYSAYQNRYDVQRNFLGQTFFQTNGDIYYSDTYAVAPDGSSSFTYSDGTFFNDKPYDSFIDRYTASGEIASETLDNRDGTHDTTAYSERQNLDSIGNDTIDANGYGITTFVFTPGFGHDVVLNFQVVGNNHDTLQLAASDFKSIAQVLHDTHNQNGSAVITDPVSGDTITLKSVTKAELKAHKADFHLA